MSGPRNLDALREYQENLVEQAKATLQRLRDGGFDKEKLIEAVALIMSFDIDAERRRKAKSIVEALERPGGAKPDRRQLMLPGFNVAYEWEPNRLISDDDGHIIENVRALPKYRNAAEGREQRNADRINERLRRTIEENRVFNAWALEQALAGRPALELTWGNCVVEKNLLV